MRRPALVALMLLTTVPAGGDWLVGLDGERIETRGAWTVQGRLVVFELPDGKLVSMPLSELDLEASAEATRDAGRPAAKGPGEPPKPPPEARVVLTDADVAHVEPGRYDGIWDERPTRSQSEEGQVTDPVLTGPEGRLEVSSWDHTLDTTVDGTLVTGRLANTSSEVASDIELAIRFLDHEGTLLATVPAILTSTTLLPGQSARFRVEAGGVYAFTEARFDFSSLGLETRADNPEAGD